MSWPTGDAVAPCRQQRQPVQGSQSLELSPAKRMFSLAARSTTKHPVEFRYVRFRELENRSPEMRIVASVAFATTRHPSAYLRYLQSHAHCENLDSSGVSAQILWIYENWWCLCRCSNHWRNTIVDCQSWNDQQLILEPRRDFDSEPVLHFATCNTHGSFSSVTSCQ